MKRREISKSVGEIEEGGKIRERERGIIERNHTVHIDILLHHVILYYIILYYIISYYITLCQTTSHFYSIIFYIILYHIILCCMTLRCIIMSHLSDAFQLFTCVRIILVL